MKITMLFLLLMTKIAIVDAAADAALLVTMLIEITLVSFLISGNGKLYSFILFLKELTGRSFH